MSDEKTYRCEKTGNPCGTDTMHGDFCNCRTCVRWLFKQHHETLDCLARIGNERGEALARAERAEADATALRADLKLNAKMLARQCDLAREAETAESVSRREADGLRAALAAAQAEAAGLRGVLGAMLPLVREAAKEDVSYGYPVVEDPRDFSPDTDSCTVAEIAAHKVACEAWERGERPQRAPTHLPIGEEVVPGSGLGEHGHITQAPWGIGASYLRDPEAQALLARVNTALASTPHAGVGAALLEVVERARTWEKQHTVYTRAIMSEGVSDEFYEGAQDAAVAARDAVFDALRRLDAARKVEGKETTDG